MTEQQCFDIAQSRQQLKELNDMWPTFHARARTSIMAVATSIADLSDKQRHEALTAPSTKLHLVE